MIRKEANGIAVLQFGEEKFSGTIHGFIARRGGVSPKPWDSLNQGGTVGDLRDHVIENRRRAFDFFGRKVESIFDVWQVHGTTTICTPTARGLEATHQKADAIFTNNPQVTLFMRFADCVPIMIYDPNKRVVGLIHAGWKGTVNKIVAEAITTIEKVYGINPSNLIAGIGPSIGPDHYAIGEEVEKGVRMSFNNKDSQVLCYENGKAFFNLWKANELVLRDMGVESIECANICTACHLGDWYSHRAEKGATGRFGALIALKN